MTTAQPPFLSSDTSGLQAAAAILQGGGLVAFPTETVYGLGGDATNDHAVAAIFEAKGRPAFNPLIVHFPNAESIWPHVDIEPATQSLVNKLADAFWPGPLTMVLKRRTDSSLSLLVSAGLDTLAVRVPAHDIAHNLLAVVERPIAAPSANRSGGISPTQAAHVRESLGDRIDAIVDGGPCDIGIESTVIALGEGHSALLRPGSITRRDIETIIGPVNVADDQNDEMEPSAPRSPGMLKRHYAPNTRVRLHATQAEPGEVLLGFGPHALSGAPEGSLNLSEQGDLCEAAANLFAMLRQLDTLGAEAIAVMPIPDDSHGDELGIAINDRLRRAATPESP